MLQYLDTYIKLTGNNLDFATARSDVIIGPAIHNAHEKCLIERLQNYCILDIILTTVISSKKQSADHDISIS